MLLTSAALAGTAYPVIIDAGNWESLTEIVFEKTVGGITTTETLTGSVTATDAYADNAILTSVTIAGGIVINEFNAFTPIISSNNFASLDLGKELEVYTPSTTVDYLDAGFLNALVGVSTSADLMQYINVGADGSTPIWDTQFSSTVGLNTSDYIFVEERNGNTDFTLTALDLAGNVIAGAAILEFDDGSYQWDIGLKNTLDESAIVQTQEISVVSIDLFNTTTDIGGFRVNDPGGADVKFFIGSAIPEPSSVTLLGISSLALLLRRKRS